MSKKHSAPALPHAYSCVWQACAVRIGLLHRLFRDDPCIHHSPVRSNRFFLGYRSTLGSNPRTHDWLHSRAYTCGLFVPLGTENKCALLVDHMLYTVRHSRCHTGDRERAQDM